MNKDFLRMPADGNMYAEIQLIVDLDTLLKGEHMEFLLWATPTGLALDVVGFILLIRFGHRLFLRSGTGPPPDNWKDGDFYFQYAGAADDGHEKRMRFWAHLGVTMVVAGFCIQIVGSVAAILLTSQV